MCRRISSFFVLVLACLPISIAVRGIDVQALEPSFLVSQTPTQSHMTSELPVSSRIRASNISQQYCVPCQRRRRRGKFLLKCRTPKWHPCNANRLCCSGWRCANWKYGKRCEPWCVKKWYSCDRGNSYCCGGWGCKR